MAAADARQRFSLESIVAEYEAFYEYTLALPQTVAATAGATSPSPSP
jgi:hypothetical protein